MAVKKTSKGQGGRGRSLDGKPLSPAEAAKYFRNKLSAETDAWDLHANLQAGTLPVIVADGRSPEAYQRRHIRGAISRWHRDLDATAAEGLDRKALVVVYGNDEACNAGTKAAARWAALGFRVKEMIGGLRAWDAYAFPVEGSSVRSAKPRRKQKGR
jgi:rhodanese-related sulfurtransferase